MLSVKERPVLEKAARCLLLANQLILPCCLHPVDFDTFQLPEAMLGELLPEVAS
jgi:hypothetical protein